MLHDAAEQIHLSSDLFLRFQRSGCHVLCVCVCVDNSFSSSSSSCLIIVNNRVTPLLRITRFHPAATSLCAGTACFCLFICWVSATAFRTAAASAALSFDEHRNCVGDGRPRRWCGRWLFLGDLLTGNLICSSSKYGADRLLN